MAHGAAFDFLARRQSCPARALTGPAPSRAALEPILQAALRVPDHGGLQPWRLVVIPHAAMPRLAELAESIARNRGYDDERIQKGRGQFDRGISAVAVISAPKPVDKIPLIEQRLSAGALCLGVVNAAQAAGWGACWLTGWVSHDADFAARAFGCQGDEQVAGIVHIGTATTLPPDRPRPDLGAVVEWMGDEA